MKIKILNGYKNENKKYSTSIEMKIKKFSMGIRTNEFLKKYSMGIKMKIKNTQ
jgi:hypothetical protein